MKRPRIPNPLRRRKPETSPETSPADTSETADTTGSADESQKRYKPVFNSAARRRRNRRIGAIAAFGAVGLVAAGAIASVKQDNKLDGAKKDGAILIESLRHGKSDCADGVLRLSGVTLRKSPAVINEGVPLIQPDNVLEEIPNSQEALFTGPLIGEINGVEWLVAQRVTPKNTDMGPDKSSEDMVDDMVFVNLTELRKKSPAAANPEAFRINDGDSDGSGGCRIRTDGAIFQNNLPSAYINVVPEDMPEVVMRAYDPSQVGEKP